MCNRLSGTLLPILALIALSTAGAPARAADDDVHSQEQYGAFGAQTDAQSRKTAATRIYVPLHPAQPHEVGEEFAPIQATAFGAARSGQAQAGAPNNTSAGKLPAARDLGLHTGNSGGVIIQTVKVPNGD